MVKEIKHNRVVSVVHTYLSSLRVLKDNHDGWYLYDSCGYMVVEIYLYSDYVWVQFDIIPQEISIYEAIIFKWVEDNKKYLIHEGDKRN